MSDRLLPLDAERAVLGSLLLDRDVIADVAEIVATPDAFTLPPHRALYRAVLALFARHEPADVVTLTAYLATQPGAPDASYLAGLMADVPTSVHAGYYAQLVRNAARLRALQTGYQDALRQCVSDPALDPADVLAGLVGTLMDDGGTQTAGPRAYADLIPETQERIVLEQAGVIERDETPTGFWQLDDVLNGGAKPGELIVLAARSSMGKALALDTAIPTPVGWSTMGDLRVGDIVFDEAGYPCRVTYATPTQLNRYCYRVTFSDGSTIIADADHRWLTETYAVRNKRAKGDPSVVTTEEIRATLYTTNRHHSNHAIKNAHALQLEHAALPIPPYTLGAWLGDGRSDSARIITADWDVLAEIARDGMAVGEARPCNGGQASIYAVGSARLGHGRNQQDNDCLQRTLRGMGLLNNKHIPPAYLRGSHGQRRRLLGGLMDTDGYVDPKTNVCEFVSKSERLAREVAELVTTLGWIPSVKTGRALCNGKDCGLKWRIRFSPDAPVFWLKRKLANQRIGPRPKASRRYIVGIDPVESVPVRCITVDSPNHLYLCGTGMIPTHNTAFSYELLRTAARRGIALLFSAEMSTDAITRRGISRETGIPLARLDRAKLSPGEYAAFMTASEHMKTQRIHIDDLSGITTDQILVRTQRVQRAGKVALVVFDYMELAGDQGKRNEPENLRVGQIVHKLKHIARVCHVPVVALSQVSREVETRKTMVPKLSDLRWSGAIEQDADKVLFLYRHDYYVQQGIADPIPELEGICQVYVSKHRNGPTGSVKLRYVGECFRFESLEPSYAQVAAD